MIDLHIHTKFSDGTDSIEELVEKVINKGIKYFSITDHDNIGGVSYLLNDNYLMELLDKNEIKFINGVEFSSIINGNKVHILGYDYNLGKEFLDIISLSQQKRLHKFELRLKALKEQFNIEFSENSLNELRDQCEFVGKPILARYMQKDGICDDYRMCFDKYLNELKVPAFETRIDANIVLPAIVGSEGVAVWAHPLGGIGEERISLDKVEEIISMLIPLGLKGLECYYNMYSNEECEALVDIARKYNLKISAGSDYHGLNKNVELGQLNMGNDITLTNKQVTIIEEIR